MKFLFLFSLLINSFKIYDKALYERILPDVSISEKLGNYTYTLNFEKNFLEEIAIKNDFARSIFNDFYFDGLYYYIVGAETKLREENNVSSLDAVVYKVDEKANILKQSKIRGSNEDSLEKIAHYGSDYIYTVGLTKSDDLDYLGLVPSNALDSGFISLFDSDLNLLKMVSIGKYLEVEDLVMKLIDNKIYLFFSHISFGKQDVMMQVYDLELNLISEKSLNLNRGRVYDFIKVDDQFFLAGSSKDSKLVGIPKELATLFILDLEANLVDSKTYLSSDVSYYNQIYLEDDKVILTGNMGEVSRKILSNQTSMFISTYKNDLLKTIPLFNSKINGLIYYEDYYYLYGTYYEAEAKVFHPVIYKMKEDFSITKEIPFKKKEGEIIKALGTNSGLEFIMNTSSKKSNTRLINASLLNLKELHIKEDFPTMFTKELRKETLSYLEDYNPNLFGTYFLYDTYTNPYFEVYNHFREKRVRLETNLKEMTYRKPFTIKSNAIMYLDGKRVENGYLIDEDGIYQMMFYGANGETRELIFELALPSEVIEVPEVKPDIEEDLKNEEIPKVEENLEDGNDNEKNDLEQFEDEKEELEEGIIKEKDPFDLKLIDENILKYLSILFVFFLLMLILLINAIKH